MSEGILIVDADEGSASALERAFRDAGFDVRHTADGEEALALLHEGPDLAIVSMEIHGLRGPELLRRIRRTDGTSELPVIATSSSPDEIDRVLSFELGADDFVAKPISRREIVLRARAVLRRARIARRVRPPKTLEAGLITIDTQQQQVKVEGREVHLTQVELRLLTDLAARSGHVQRREQLLERVWPDADLGERTVDTHIRRLREKLGPAAEQIETVRGVGYRFRLVRRCETEQQSPRA